MNEDSFIRCYECGIRFGFDSETFVIWRQNQKPFQCPNGHSNYIVTEDRQAKEIKTLKDEINKLKEKLADAEAEAESANKAVAELMQELEIWRPQMEEQKQA